MSSETQPKAVIATLSTKLSTKPDAKLPPVTSSHVITKDQLSAAVTDASRAEGETAAGPISGPVQKGKSFLFKPLSVILFLFLLLCSFLQKVYFYLYQIFHSKD